MGIVRDVTVDQLTQAVNNIDTSTLAQDSTLQDVVTAIGNISGGNDPVTNTTVNSLCKDTTGQDIKDELTAIKSAVQGLGTALGSDKANISGNNIADKATFISNIGAAKNTWTLINGNIQTDTEQTLTGYNEYLIILVYSGIRIAGMILPSDDVGSTISIRSVISGAQVIEGYYNNSTHKWTLTANCYIKLYGR